MAAVVTGLSLPDSPEPPDPPDPPSTLTILATSVSIVVELSTLTYLDLKVTDLNLSNQIFKELPLSKDFGLMNQCRCHTTPYCSMQTFYHHHFNLWPWTASLSPSQTVVSLHLTRSTPSHAADSYCRFPPSLTASSSHHLSQTPDLFYSTFLLTFQECVLQIASQALEFRAAGSVDIIPSSLSLPLDQLLCYSLLQYAVPFPEFDVDSYKCVDVRSIQRLSIWCIVTSAFIADFRIDILAQCAVPISGVGLLSVADNPQLDFPLLSITEVECRGPLFIFSVLSFSWRVRDL
ncbi:hypothetical protein Bca4012_040915 [Brassica carinata]